MNSGIPHEVSIRHDEPFLRPEWVPEYGHAPRLAGVYFDAVRIHGCRGEEIMSALMDWQGWAAGPIIHLATTNEVTFVNTRALYEVVRRNIAGRRTNCD